jgi:hypothetical protein
MVSKRRLEAVLKALAELTNMAPGGRVLPRPAPDKGQPQSYARSLVSWRSERPTASAMSQRPIGTDAIVVVDLGFVGSVAPVRLFIHIVGGSPFELTLVEVNDIAALAGVVLQNRPR